MVSDLVVISKQTLTPAEYSDLADVPPELEWLANVTNPRTRRASKIDVGEFLAFTGLREPTALRTVTRRACYCLVKDSGGTQAGSR